MKNLVLVAVLAITLATTSIPTSALGTAESTWVVMAGRIVSYGGESVGGWSGALAKIDEWAEVNAFWVKPQIMPIPGNYTFHWARLVNASMVKLNYTGNDFYIAGLWDVLKITLVYDLHGNVTKVFEVIADDARGELTVTDGWRNFRINIENVPSIAGVVYFYRIVHTKPVPKGDVTSEAPNVPDGKINIWDLVHVARAYGETPKPWGKYDFNIDFNFDFTIDIYDLTTLAANLGENY